MIDLTPLDIRKKKGDFGRGLRGYDPQEVDTFLELVADRLEEVVRENLTLRERVTGLSEQVHGQEGREKAVQEALVTAQALRSEIQEQARREADLVIREAETRAEEVRKEAEAQVEAARRQVQQVLDERRRELVELNRARARFLKGFRTLLERELDAVEIEESNTPAEDFGVTPTADTEPDPEDPWREGW